MKKIISLIIMLTIFTFTIELVNATECSYSPSWDIIWNIDSCLSWTDLVDSSWDVSIEWSFKDKLIDWSSKIAWFLWLIAVWALVYAAFMMTISWGEEEKIKKAKDIIKWTILWFLGVVLASSLIAIVVKFMYSF